jgi:superfamily II DNA or RNA helicase
MELRTYQSAAIASLRASLQSGKKRPVMQLPTGAGKTIIAAAIIKMAREKGKRVIFAVPALSLIDQTVERFIENGIWEIAVMQGDHEMTDRSQPVQVCSIQTLARRKLPDADLVIVDECHVMFKFMANWIKNPDWEKVPFVGLTATPWAKGMGKIWDDLIIATTTDELIRAGHLSDFKVFAPAHPDLSNVKTVAGDYKLDELAEAMDQGALVADVVTTWLEQAQQRPTVCFAVNRTHAKHLQKQFEASGVPTGYMDAYTDRLQRGDIVKKFENGEIKVLCNVGVLTTGFDADVRCIILARPTKSEMLFVQMIGRGLRTAHGKDHCLILDHSDTTIRLGFVTDIHHTQLDDGSAKKAKAEKKERLPKECPKCAFLKPPKVQVCPNCGFKAEAVSDIETVNGELYELTRDKQIKPKDWTIDQKQQFYSELLGHAHLRGYKSGWAYHAYKARLGVGPSNMMDKHPTAHISPETQSWIKHYNIVKAKQREKAGKAFSKVSYA